MEVINRIKGEVVGSPFYKVNLGVVRGERVKGHDLIHFSNRKVRSQVVDLANDIIFKMSSGMSVKYPRPILISINVLGPISLEKAKSMNSNRDYLAGNITVVALSPLPVIARRYGGDAGGFIAGAVSVIVSPFVQSYIRGQLFPYSSVDDVIIVVEGIVSGGIGQQHSIESKVITRSLYDPAKL